MLEFFDACGVLVLEGYGMTETCAAATLNTPRAVRFGSVGRPLVGSEVAIAEDGEILMAGPHVFEGYHRDAAATEDVMPDRWLRSGDLGEIDADGYLHITGRKKDLIITSSGKNISPENLESALRETRWISQAVVSGDRRPYLVALLTLDPDEAPRLAEELGIPADLATMAHDERVRAAIQEDVDAVNARFARIEQIKRFDILERDLSQAEGELTPTLKVKRPVDPPSATASASIGSTSRERRGRHPGPPSRLRDGSRVVVRPVRADDRERLRAGFERLSPESRYQRFLAPMAELSEADLTYLTDVDHHDHEALAAIDPETGEGVGVARFIRCADRPDTAEAAVTVIDDWQGRGVGTALLDLLADARGPRVSRASPRCVLAENRDMLEVLEGVAPIHVVERQRGTIEIEAELPPTGAGPHLQGLLGQAARASASSSSRNASASACGSGTSPASVRKPTVTLPA